MKQSKLLKPPIEPPIRSNKRWQERQRAKALLHQLGAELESYRSVKKTKTHSVILSHGRKVVLHKPCDSAKEAVRVCATLQKYVVDGADVEITITNDLELVDQILRFTEELIRWCGRMIIHEKK